MIDSVNDVASRLNGDRLDELNTPVYNRREGTHAGLAVASMKDHMTDEGWQLFAGLAGSGYALCGHGLPVNTVSVPDILSRLNPAVVLLQDKREWDAREGSFRDPEARFRASSSLADRSDVFKLTVLKDAHQRPAYHRQAAQEIGCHAWITYYATPIVKKLATYVRTQHLIRTYHTLDPAAVPPYSPNGRGGCLLSGAVSSAYPLRQRLFREAGQLHDTVVMPHPGYHRNGCMTPAFMKELAKYRVEICTASRFGYALRKMAEATACGCVVVTNLPHDEVMPEIDGNLIRVPSNVSTVELNDLVQDLMWAYDPDKQEAFAKAAVKRYDYRVETARIASEIETLRDSY